MGTTPISHNFPRASPTDSLSRVAREFHRLIGLRAFRAVVRAGRCFRAPNARRARPSRRGEHRRRQNRRLGITSPGPCPDNRTSKETTGRMYARRRSSGSDLPPHYIVHEPRTNRRWSRYRPVVGTATNTVAAATGLPRCTPVLFAVILAGCSTPDILVQGPRPVAQALTGQPCSIQPGPLVRRYLVGRSSTRAGRPHHLFQAPRALRRPAPFAVWPDQSR